MTCLPLAARGQNAYTKPSILIIHSYNQGYRWTDNQNRGLMEGLAPFSGDYELHIEYLDWKRYPDTALLDESRKWLEQKYRQRLPSLIVTTDDAALKTAITLRKAWRAAMPLIFTGVTKTSFLSVPDRDQNITGVYENIDVSGTMQVLGLFRPDPKSIYLICDNTETGTAFRKQIIAELFSLGLQDRLVALNDDDFPAIKARLASADPDSAALIVAYNTTAGGVTRDPGDWSLELSRSSAVPLFAVHDYYLGAGIVGGQLIDGYRHGQAAAALAAQILGGRPVSSLAVIDRLLTTAGFDQTMVTRFKLQNVALPPGAQVIHLESNFFQRYPAVVAGALAIIAFLTGLSLVLAVSNRRRKIRYQLKLADAERQAALGRIVIGVSHHMSTPLGNSLTSVTYLNDIINQLDRPVPFNRTELAREVEKLRHCQQFIHNGIKQSIRMLTRFRQVQAANNPQDQVELKLSESLIPFLTHWNMQTEHAWLRMETDIPPDISVRCNEPVLHQVLRELLENVAMHAYQPKLGSPLRVRAHKDGAGIRLEVIDEGCGIPPDTLEVIFEPFVTHNLSKGSGLGLPIVNSLVHESLKGTIAITCDPGRGTQVAIRLPRQGA